jgi:hypothetical protein
VNIITDKAEFRICGESESSAKVIAVDFSITNRFVTPSARGKEDKSKKMEKQLQCENSFREGLFAR